MTLGELFIWHSEWEVLIVGWIDLLCSAGARTVRMRKWKKRRPMRQPSSTKLTPIASPCGSTCTFSSVSGVINRRPSSISAPFPAIPTPRTLPAIGSCMSSFFKTEAPHLTTHFRGKIILFYLKNFFFFYLKKETIFVLFACFVSLFLSNNLVELQI